jgi:hypothetical protein
MFRLSIEIRAVIANLDTQAAATRGCEYMRAFSEQNPLRKTYELFRRRLLVGCSNHIAGQPSDCAGESGSVVDERPVFHRLWCQCRLLCGVLRQVL